jgi:Holliday junction resolvase-like predicted endonuclease
MKRLVDTSTTGIQKKPRAARQGLGRTGERLAAEELSRRGNVYGLPEEAVTYRKRQKIVQVASYYLDLHACSERSWRIECAVSALVR